jgi:CTP:molybdopterin cytidylyltransferase MocA
MRLSAIVLAAGEGRRMGTPKALLEVGGVTLVERHVGRLVELGCEAIAVVVRPEVAVAPSLRSMACVRIVEARTASQAESLAAGLRALEGIDDPILVTPVDLMPPGLATLRTLLDALAPSVDAVTPVHGGRGGHPVIARHRVLAGSSTGLEGVPLRARLAALGPRRLRIPVEDASVLGDFDVPADLER